MKKKYLVTTVAMLAAVSMLAACGNKNNNGNNEVTPTVTVAPTEAPSSDERGDGPSTPAPTEAPEVAVDHNQMIQNVVQALKDMKKKDLCAKAGISSSSITKMGKNGHVTTEVLLKICTALECQVADIMEIIPEDK